MAGLKIIKRIFKPFVFSIQLFTILYQTIRESQMRAGIPKEIPMGFKFSGNPEM